MATDTPLTLSRPILASMLQSPAAPDAVLVDWLTDQQATLADVLRLYAGTPPSFTDGLPQSALALWLRTHEPCLHRREVEATRKVLGYVPLTGLMGAGEPSPLWQEIAAVKCDPGPEPQHRPPEWLMPGATRGRFVGYHPRPEAEAGYRGRVIESYCRYCQPSGSMAVPPRLWLYYVDANHAGRPLPRPAWMGSCLACRTAHWGYQDDGPERRAQKRRVLSYFPGVDVPVTAALAKGPGLPVWASGTLEVGEICEIGEDDSSWQYTSQAVPLADGRSVTALPGRPLHIDAERGTVTYLERAVNLIMDEAMVTYYGRSKLCHAYRPWAQASPHVPELGS